MAFWSSDWQLQVAFSFSPLQAWVSFLSSSLPNSFLFILLSILFLSWLFLKTKWSSTSNLLWLRFPIYLMKESWSPLQHPNLHQKLQTLLHPCFTHSSQPPFALRLSKGYGQSWGCAGNASASPGLSVKIEMHWFINNPQRISRKEKFLFFFFFNYCSFLQEF